MNKVALYMRISVEEFGERIESESISSQRLLITDYILKDSELRNYEKIEYIEMKVKEWIHKSTLYITQSA